MTARTSGVWQIRILVLFLLCLSVLAQDIPSLTDPQLTDPILRYRPPFVWSLPVQILITGIVFALVAVLLIHLIFTAQYHWALAQVNFVLQVSSVLILLISLIAAFHVILESTIEESTKWPYMLSYVAVPLPPTNDTTGWSAGELAAWYFLDATTSGLIQITHIQFMTLLYPSPLERRLILTLLGPLAITSAIMELLPIVDHPTANNVADVISNVCNATLSLLFTASLFIYGLLVNRRQAWRTDGGTAAFGAGALVLAIMSTCLTFVYIPSKDQYEWMQPLIWAVIMWQTFLGWWWWVGAGMGTGEVDELLRREEKRNRKRRIRTERRRERKEKAARVIKDVFSFRSRSTAVSSGVEASSSTGSGATQRPSARHTDSTSSLRTAPSASTSTSTSTGAGSSWPRLLHAWLGRLRHAHILAVRRQAVEHVERIQQVYGKEHPELGWGLGAFGVREMERRESGRDVDDPEVLPHAESEQGVESERRASRVLVGALTTVEVERLDHVLMYEHDSV